MSTNGRELPVGPSRRRSGNVALLGALVLLAVLLRAYNLGWPPLWVDEAESSINALTIVADGAPVDHFLGQPLYENTLVRPWPENREYEFRDISYSDKGLAVYHGWLPLYAIAGAFRLAGFTPEQARRGTPPRDGSPAEIGYWTIVPRLPSIVFSALFVVAMYGLGRAVDDAPVGWAVALAAATAQFFVSLGRQARYYSAAFAGTAACGLAIWNALRRGRVSDHALAGFAIGMLFHTYSLSAVTMAAVYVGSLPLARNQPRLWVRVLAAGTVGGLLVLPWAAWSGLLGHTAHIPAARDYLDLPMLLGSLPHPVVLLPAGLGLAWLAIARLYGDRVPDQWRRPIVDRATGLYFAAIWLALSYVVFGALIPAASYFVDRYQLMMAVPGLLLDALVIGAVSRATRPSWAFLPAAGVVALLALSGQLPPRLWLGKADHRFASMMCAVRSWNLGPDGRIFATSNEHLTLTYYTGRPIQSISPIRREWLDGFAGDLVVLQGGWFESLDADEVLEAARELGREVTVAEAVSRAHNAAELAVAVDLVASGAVVVPPPPVPDALDRALLTTVKRKTRQQMIRRFRRTPLGHPVTPSDWREWHNAFFYFFSDPDRRTGTGLNYRACRDSAVVQVHASGFLVYDCRKTRERPLLSTAADPVCSP